VESFRPGTLERWGLGSEALCADNPRLVWCSLTSWGRTGQAAALLGHDLNFMAATGALAELGGAGVPGLQIADIAGALLAGSAILAALYDRERHGQGRVLDQPLAAGPLPFLTWAFAEASAGGGTERAQLLAGRCPCYRTYRCGDGVEIAVGALEPKFWMALVQLLGVPELAAAGYDPGDEGAAAAARLAEIFSAEPGEHWLALAAAHGLPVSPVRSAAEAVQSAELADRLEDTPVAGGGSLRTPGPLFGCLGRTPARPIGAVGEDTRKILEEFGVS
jgi:alpha-methylacyl-CoA racemase